MLKALSSDFGVAASYYGIKHESDSCLMVLVNTTTRLFLKEDYKEPISVCQSMTLLP
jgi:hypothetical protein